MSRSNVEGAKTELNSGVRGLIMSFGKSFARYMYCRMLGFAAHSEQPDATHLPVFIGVASVHRPQRVVEFGSGSGYFSTLTFLDQTVFPSVLRADSYENNSEWMRRMQVRLAGNPRATCDFFEGRMRDAVSRADLAAADLIFIDDSLTGWERAHTIKELARVLPESTITIVHDYELPALRIASRKFEHQVEFTTFTPQNCAVWNGNPHRRALLESVARRLEENASCLNVTGAGGWAKVFLSRTNG